MKPAHKINFGFLFGGIFAVIGFTLQFMEEYFTLKYISQNIWVTGSSTPGMQHVSYLVLLIFGLLIIVVTFNRWLQSDREQ